MDFLRGVAEGFLGDLGVLGTESPERRPCNGGPATETLERSPSNEFPGTAADATAQPATESSACFSVAAGTMPTHFCFT